MESLPPIRPPYKPCVPCANLAILMLSGCTGYSLYQYFLNRPYTVWYKHLSAIALPLMFAGLTVRQWGLRKAIIDAETSKESSTSL